MFGHLARHVAWNGLGLFLQSQILHKIRYDTVD